MCTLKEKQRNKELDEIVVSQAEPLLDMMESHLEMPDYYDRCELFDFIVRVYKRAGGKKPYQIK
jgi:hypothetical protein